MSFHHGFENGSDRERPADFNEYNGWNGELGIKKVWQGYIFEEPKWFLVKIIFLVAFLNKDQGKFKLDMLKSLFFCT